MRKLLYALAAVAVIAPLAAFGTASAAPAHRAAPAVHAVRPFNLPATKCFQITDAGGGDYGSLWFDGSKVVTSHSNHTPWCPYGPMADGSQILQDPTNSNDLMAFQGSWMTEYANSHSSACDVHNIQAGLTANTFCEWSETYNSNTGLWTIQNEENGEYLTSTSSGAAVKLGGSGDTTWLITCLRYC
jgi:hypothetical protein